MGGVGATEEQTSLAVLKNLLTSPAHKCDRQMTERHDYVSLY